VTASSTIAARNARGSLTEGRSTEELKDLVFQVGAELELAPAENIIEWAVATFGSRFCVTSSMGDAVLAHLTSKVAPGVDVIFLDTGYHFAETLGTRDAYAAMLPIKLRTVLPLQTVAQQDAEYGPKLHDRDPDRCCALRKVEPLERALSDKQAWVTGMRREDAPTRTDIAVVGFDERRGMVKLNPLAAWTAEDVARYTEENGVFENPLRQVGFASIGCAPCTRAVADGEDPRAGRWSGRAKTECGLHT